MENVTMKFKDVLGWQKMPSKIGENYLQHKENSRYKTESTSVLCEVNGSIQKRLATTEIGFLVPFHG